MENQKPPVHDIYVVFVDDDQHILEEMKDFLTSRVSRLETACNGMEALEICRNSLPDLVITDIQMPVMNGLDLTKNLRKLSDRLKIMITTAFDETSYLLDAIGAGVDFFLLKPYALGTILEKMALVAGQKALERSVRKQAALLEDYRLALDATAAILKTDLDGDITYANDLYSQISGYSRQDLVGQNPRIVKNPGTPPSYYKDLWETISSGKIWQGSLENRSRTGRSFFVDLTIVPLLDDHGKITEYMGIHQEISDAVRKERLIQNLYTDALTGLPNRMRLLDDLQECLNPSLFVVNIDGFRQINDFFGNQIGDFIIGEMGSRLKSAMNGQGAVYRIHGDEYAVLVNKPWDDGLLGETALHLNDAVSGRPYTFREADIRLNVTIGCAYGRQTAPPSPESHQGQWSSLTNQANMAMRRARKLKKDYLLYNDNLEVFQEYEHNLFWTSKVRQALEENRIVPFFQPILNHGTGKIEKYECLVRLKEGNGSIISPVHFLDVAKRSRLYESLTKTVISRSLEKFRHSTCEFSMNVSMEDIMNEDTRVFILDLMARNPEPARRGVFEILESEGIENYIELNNFILAVKDLGAKIAIDDYGSGYSNLAHIMKLQADYIKIDGSIIKDICTSSLSQVLVKNVVATARELGMKTIAEFVSTQEIYQTVRDLGVDYSQGYFVGAPSPEPEA